MASANKDEQVQIKREMSLDPALAAIVTALESSDEVDPIQEEQQRRIKQRKANIEAQLNMEVDQPGAEVGGQVAGQRKVLDMTEMAFQQGSHYMATRKIQMPNGTQREDRKADGYEIIHIPTPARKPLGENEVTN